MLHPAAHKACIGCGKGETNCGFVVFGDVDWTGTVLHVFAGLPIKDAATTAVSVFGEAVASYKERLESVVRLCPCCASKTGAPVYSMATITERPSRASRWPMLW